MKIWTYDDTEKLKNNIHKNSKNIFFILNEKFSIKSIMMKINRLGLHDKYFKYEKYRNSKISKEYLLYKYSLEPKLCKHCLNIIDYDNRNINLFCNSSCSGKFNNKFRIGLKYNLSEQGLENLRINALKNFHGNEKDKEKHIREKKTVSLTIKEKKLKKIKECNHCHNLTTNKFFCSIECWTDSILKSKTEYEIYKKETNFKFNLDSFPNEFDFTLIEKYGWYSPSNCNKPNLNGISRDHILSVNEGFKLGIDPKLLRHPANCRLIPHTENQKKKTKSNISFQDLLLKIKIWDERYQ